jgi:uncharacterized protein YceH (UPF0502 family)
MAELPDGGMVESLLEGLASRPEGGLVQQLPREAGRRDSRWAQLFEELPPQSAQVAVPRAHEAEAPSPRAASQPDLAARVTALEQALDALRAEIAKLRQQP